MEIHRSSVPSLVVPSLNPKPLQPKDPTTKVVTSKDLFRSSSPPPESVERIKAVAFQPERQRDSLADLLNTHEKSLLSRYAVLHQGAFIIFHAQRKGCSPKFYVAWRKRKYSAASGGKEGGYDIFKIGSYRLILEIRSDRGCSYLRTNPETVYIPTEYRMFAHYQQLELVWDATCEDHYILVNKEATGDRLYDLFYDAYPWCASESRHIVRFRPRLCRAGSERVYLRLNPKMLNQ